MASFLAPFLALIFASGAASAPMVVDAFGPGISARANSDHACPPMTATKVLLFFLTNYVAHATTVKLPPGAPSIQAIGLILKSLVFPIDGIDKAVDTIFRWSWKLSPRFPFVIMEADSLETALNAGALVVAMRTPRWKPAPSDGLIRDLRQPDDESEDPLWRLTRAIKRSPTNVPSAHDPQNRDLEVAATVTPKTGDPDPGTTAARRESNRAVPPSDADGRSSPAFSRPTLYKYVTTPLDGYGDGDEDRILLREPNVHGGFQLPEGYDWVRLPPNAKVKPYGRPVNEDQPSADAPAQVHLTTSFSTLQPIIAIVQTVNAGWTLYKTRGDQLNQFGFAAFGFTVTPYLLMSIVNFIAQLATPQYTSVYMVYSEILAEAAARAGNPRIIGIVGEVTLDSSASSEYSDGWLSDERDGFAVLTRAGHEDTEENAGRDRSAHKDGAEIPTQVVEKAASERGELVKEIYVPYHPRFELSAPRNFLEKILYDQLSGRFWASVALCVIISLIPVAVIGATSKFEPGQSTQVQRGIMIAWLIFSVASQVIVVVLFYMVVALVTVWLVVRGKEVRYHLEDLHNAVLSLYGFLVVAQSAVPLAMFVMVGQELMQYGNCEPLG